MKEFLENLKNLGLILGVSMLLFLADGYGTGSYDGNVFFLFFMGAVFGQGVGHMRGKNEAWYRG